MSAEQEALLETKQQELEQAKNDNNKVLVDMIEGEIAFLKTSGTQEDYLDIKKLCQQAADEKGVVIKFSRPEAFNVVFGFNRNSKSMFPHVTERAIEHFFPVELMVTRFQKLNKRMGGSNFKRKKKQQEEARKRKEAGEDISPTSFKRQKKEDVWQNDREDWTDITYTNDNFESYYKDQEICADEEEWQKFLASLKAHLPAAIRFSPPSAKRLRDELITGLSKVSGIDGLKSEELQWFSDKLAWQWTVLDRRAIRKEPGLVALKEFLFREEVLGTLSRQEAVSMIPPIFLGVQSHHNVLDMCAAPGSKTTQMLEASHWGLDLDKQGSAHPHNDAKGIVIANDVDWKRAHMLAHQVQRMGAPSTVVVNTDAQFFPILKKEDGTEFLFDRILCDVPCSGDGTLRKQPAIWNKWSRMGGNGLHFRQYTILIRGLCLLKPGGRLVYSTCSLNPIEDEAVIAGALSFFGSDVKLVPPPELPGMNGREGKKSWKVPKWCDNADGYYDSHEDVPEELKFKMKKTLWPPTDQAVLDQLPLSRRFLPHVMDTGGFFVATFERVSGFAKPEDALPQKEDEEEEAVSEPASPEPTEEKSEEKSEQKNVESGDGKKKEWVPMSRKEKRERKRSKNMSKGTWLPWTQEFKELSDEIYNDIKTFFDLPDDFPRERLKLRMTNNNMSKAHIYFMSESNVEFLKCQVRSPMRAVHCGVKVFSKQQDFNSLDNDWRLCQEGMQAFAPFLKKRTLTVSKELFTSLVEDNFLTVPDLLKLDCFKKILKTDSENVSPGAVYVVCEDKFKNEPPPFATCIVTPSNMQICVEPHELTGIKAAIDTKPLSDLVQAAINAAAEAKVNVATPSTAAKSDQPMEQA
eukprot:gene491-507_t